MQNDIKSDILILSTNKVAALLLSLRKDKWKTILILRTKKKEIGKRRE